MSRQATYPREHAHYGDADVAHIAVLFGEPSRARILMALADGRALPASVLATEAGLSAPAASAQLARLSVEGLITVEPSGRHRYYRLARPEVAAVLEAMAAIAPTRPVRSLTEGTRANNLRVARTCYDHLAGQLGVNITAALLTQGALATIDGIPSTQRRHGDRLSAAVEHHPYVLGPDATTVFERLGVDLDMIATNTGGRHRPLLRFCMDWTEQQHHLAGKLGAAMFQVFERNGWVARSDQARVVRLTTTGLTELTNRFDISPSSLARTTP